MKLGETCGLRHDALLGQSRSQLSRSGFCDINDVLRVFFPSIQFLTICSSVSQHRSGEKIEVMTLRATADHP
jgi:hypothetical protein